MIDTDQQRAGRSIHYGLERNADGSIDLFFAPDKPKSGEAN